MAGSILTSLSQGSAFANGLELRVGVAEYAQDSLGFGIQVENGVENSVALTGELIFPEPAFLRWALSPQPYLNATINLGGETSFAGAGLLWRQGFGDRFYGDFAFGLAAHDGTTEIPLFPLDEGVRRLTEERQYGSRILFRQQLTLGYRINDRWTADMFFEHLSNGDVLGDPGDRFASNDGVDNIGVRLGYRFGG